MERINNLNNMMKDGGGGGGRSFAASNNNSYYSSRDMLGRFSWPPRPYTCSFCKREFRSAQALGGHMNVHRRDRARLRQSSPCDDQSPNKLNSNPNLFNYSSVPSSSSANNKNHNPVVPFTYNFPPLSSSTTTPSITCLSSSPSADHEVKIPSRVCSSFDPSSSKDDNRTNFTKKRTLNKSYFEVGELKGFIQEDDEYKNLKRGEIVTLDLEIGLSSKDDLDLELRLGYS